MLAIHHHFRFHSAFLNNPVRFRRIAFESIPFFKLYPMPTLKRARDVIDVLSCEGMPHRFQKIVSRLTPPHQVAYSRHRAELVPLTYCTYNRQSFFIRAYRMRANPFFKVEITLHSNTLGRGKYYDFEKALRSAESLFERLEEDISSLDLIGRHCDEYFLCEQFRKEVSVFEKPLYYLKQTTNRRTRGSLKERLIAELKEFQKNATGIAAGQLSKLKLKMDTRTNQSTLH